MPMLQLKMHIRYVEKGAALPDQDLMGEGGVLRVHCTLYFKGQRSALRDPGGSRRVTQVS